MARKLRIDVPGAWYHIGNGGVGDRTIFESRRDARYFLSLLARAVREGWIEIHAFVVMSNHFHLLLRSPRGMLSKAMQWIEQQYAIYFNRTRCRTGAVFGKRFFSSNVRSDAYWITMVRYIDLNPIRANIATTPDSFPFGSARYVLTSRIPRWLSVAELAMYLGDGEKVDPERYRQFWAGVATDQVTDLVESRQRSIDPADDYLDQLLRGEDGGVLSWVRRLAKNADGIPPAATLLPPTHTLSSLGDLQDEMARFDTGRSKFTTHDALCAGVLRTSCGESVRAICSRLGYSYSTVVRLLHRHRGLLATEDAYARTVSAFLRRRLERTFPIRKP